MLEEDCQEECNKTAKSRETMAFDCPLVWPEILKGLQDTHLMWSNSTGKSNQYHLEHKLRSLFICKCLVL